jgi:hypothetical protein
MTTPVAMVAAGAAAATMTDHRHDESLRAGAPGAPALTTPLRPSAGSAAFGGAAAVFLVTLAFLALEVRAGNDPAIGAGQPQAAAPAPQPMVVRRIVERRIVRRHRATPASGEGAAAGGSAPAVRAGAPTPAAGAPAPAPAAPRPAPAPAPAAPAPAPAPAPVVSRAS